MPSALMTRPAAALGVDARLAAWAGDFGDAYTARNNNESVLRGRIMMFARILQTVQNRMPKSCVDLGCNAGQALRALKLLGVEDTYAVEPNRKALDLAIAAGAVTAAKAVRGFAHDVDLPSGAVDLTVSSGLLVYVQPELLHATLNEIHRLSRRFIVIAEYFSPRHESIPYHGRDSMLFKNDFGGVFMDLHPDAVLLDYGFFWKRATGLDDITWWLFEKRGAVHAVA
jgi:pseudaminic acid biosynthesis-associated methylase